MPVGRRRAPDVLLERGAEAVKARPGPVGLQLDHVRGQLVGPGDLAHLDLDLDLVATADGAQELVRDRTHRQRLGIDDRVLDLDAMGLEQA
jgi:hypothetical protein